MPIAGLELCWLSVLICAVRESYPALTFTVGPSLPSDDTVSLILLFSDLVDCMR